MTQLVIIIIYLLVLLSLGTLVTRWQRGTSKDYMLASHTIGPFLLLLSLFGTTMTAFALIGSTGKAYRLGIGVYGMMASSSGIVHSLCFFFFGIKLWSLGQRYDYRTQIQFFRDRLESGRIGLLLFPILVGLVIPYLLIGVLGSGAIINGVTRGAFQSAFADYGHGVPNWMGSGMICSVVLTYVFLGGMRGTAWANAFQTLVFITLGGIAFVVIANRIGGTAGFFENMQRATQAVQDTHPEKLSRQGISQLKFLSYLLIPLSAGMFPHLFQHWLTARSARSFKLPIVVHPLLILLVWLPCVLVGVWATSATLDGHRIIPADLTNENTVLVRMVTSLSGPILAGFLSAGILAAVMSSLDSQFLCLGTMFTQDIVLYYGGTERFTDRQIIWLSRSFIVVIVLVTYLISLLKLPGVFDLGIWCFSGFTSLVPLLAASLYWKRLTRAGAYAGVLTAAVLWMFLFRQAGYPPDPKFAVFLMLPVVTMTAGSAVVMVMVSFCTAPPSQETLARYFSKS